MVVPLIIGVKGVGLMGVTFFNVGGIVSFLLMITMSYGKFNLAKSCSSNSNSFVALSTISMLKK